MCLSLPHSFYPSLEYRHHVRSPLCVCFDEARRAKFFAFCLFNRISRTWRMCLLSMSEHEVDEVKFGNFRFIKFPTAPKPLINYILVSFVMSHWPTKTDNGCLHKTIEKHKSSINALCVSCSLSLSHLKSNQKWMRKFSRCRLRHKWNEYRGNKCLIKHKIMPYQIINLYEEISKLRWSPLASTLRSLFSQLLCCVCTFRVDHAAEHKCLLSLCMRL